MEQWPSMLAVAEALQELLTAQLDDFAATQIVLSREEAVLCLGLINGLADQLGNDAGGNAGTP